MSEGHGKPVGHDPVVGPGLEDGLLVGQQESQRIGRAVVARWHLWLELVRPLHLPQGGGQGSEPPGRHTGAGDRSGRHAAHHEGEPRC